MSCIKIVLVACVAIVCIDNARAAFPKEIKDAITMMTKNCVSGYGAALKTAGFDMCALVGNVTELITSTGDSKKDCAALKKVDKVKASGALVFKNFCKNWQKLATAAINFYGIQTLADAESALAADFAMEDPTVGSGAAFLAYCEMVAGVPCA